MKSMPVIFARRADQCPQAAIGRVATSSRLHRMLSHRQPHPEEPRAARRLEGWATTIVYPTSGRRLLRPNRDGLAGLLRVRLGTYQHSTKAGTRSARADMSTRSSDSILLASPGELPPPVVSQRRRRASRALHTVRKYYLVARDAGSPLTELSNVVAYPCHKVER